MVYLPWLWILDCRYRCGVINMEKNYEDFSLGLAFFDALPVLFFSIAMLLIAARFQNIWFIIGAILCSCAGLLKVIWKIIIAGMKKDFVWLNRQMRFLMPGGFLLMVIGLFTGMSVAGLHTLVRLVCSVPSVFFFGATVIGMICMSVFACKLDPTKSRSNWIEQITNAISQGCFLLGVIFCIL